MSTTLDLVFFVIIAMLCWRGYRGGALWLTCIGRVLYRLLNGKSFSGQLLRFAPLAVGWLMLCHRVNTEGWHATAAGGIMIAMTIGLDAMRTLEEQQKTERTSCER